MTSLPVDVRTRAWEMLETFKLVDYIHTLKVEVDGGVASIRNEPTGERPPGAAKVAKDCNISVHGDLRSWKNTELAIMRRDSLYGYIAKDGRGHERLPVTPVYWYPYTAEEVGISKANEALVVAMTELIVHEACEDVVLSTVTPSNIDSCALHDRGTEREIPESSSGKQSTATLPGLTIDQAGRLGRGPSSLSTLGWKSS